jgi:mono/diheme cytochrome c family protein
MKKKRPVKIFIAIFVLVLAIAIWHFSASLYIGADKPHSAFAAWILHGVMKRSVKYHCRTLNPPQTNDTLIKLGFDHFHAMCVTCHGAPGFEQSEIGRGLTPPPPNLQKALSKWNSTEIYWIVEHGIKMTGMPSFGVTHSKESLNAIVSFLRLFSSMSTDDYAGLVKSFQPEQEEH